MRWFCGGSQSVRGEEKNWVPNLISLGRIGFVVWVFERPVGHLVARPGLSSHAWWFRARLWDVAKAGKCERLLLRLSATWGGGWGGIEYLLECHLSSKKYLFTHRLRVTSGQILGELG